MAEMLREVLEFVTEREGEPPATVALAHPAAWGAYTLELLVEAARKAGATDVQLIPEPVVAATHQVRSERASAGGCFLVYDLGGGTLDISLVRVHPAHADVDGAAGFARSAVIVGDPGGREDLGGADFDEALKAHIGTLVGRRLSSFDSSEARVIRAMAQLRAELVHAKEALSKDTRVELPLFLPGAPDVVNITRNELEASIGGHVATTMAAASHVLERA